MICAGALGTFTRFYPHIKRRYDYGTMIFVLTFCLVAVSGYRSENIFQLAHRRISTILVGVFTVMIISMIIRPVWAGEDLHKLASTNLEKLATYLEGTFQFIWLYFIFNLETIYLSTFYLPSLPKSDPYVILPMVHIKWFSNLLNFVLSS